MTTPWTDRLRRLRPAAHRALGRARGVAVVSVVAAVVAWWIVLGGWLGGTPNQSAASVALLALLLLPAAGTAVAVWTVRGVLALPEQLAALPGQAASAARVSGRRLAEDGGGTRLGRATGFLGVLWRLRGLVRDGKGTLLRVGGLARFARLGSLGFVLVLASAFLLNVAVIGLAVGVVLLRMLGVA